MVFIACKVEPRAAIACAFRTTWVQDRGTVAIQYRALDKECFRTHSTSFVGYGYLNMNQAAYNNFKEYGDITMPVIYNDPLELAAEIRKHQSEEQRVVFANGCFDLIHGGHVSYLEDAAACGDILVVGVNGDISVRSLKGDKRPICPIEERLLVLESLEVVDYLIAFDEDTCETLLRTLRPDVHAKGTDYTAENVPERAISDELGIETIITGNPKENATKTMIKKANSED